MTERATERRTGLADYVEAYPVAASTKIEAGKIVALNAAGNAVEYAKTASGTANGLIVVGRCEQTVENESSVAGDVGKVQVRARSGVFEWKNDVSGQMVTKAHVGDAVYGDDSETIRNDVHTAGGQPTAAKIGRLLAVDENGKAWVATGIPYLY